MRNVYAVYDVPAKAYGPLMEYKADAVAVREFGAACEDERSQIKKHPQDFELHYIGQMDEDTHTEGGHAKIEGPLLSDTVRVVITATQYLQARSKPSQLELLKEAANG